MPVDPKYIEELEKCRFEECLRRLDSIVREMESGNVPLENKLLFRFYLNWYTECTDHRI